MEREAVVRPPLFFYARISALMQPVKAACVSAGTAPDNPVRCSRGCRSSSVRV